MPRTPSPRIWRSWYVTEAGGRGIHKLCAVEDGPKAAKAALKKWVAQCKKEKSEAERLELLKSETPYTVRQIIGEFLQAKGSKKPATIEFYRKFLKAWSDHCEQGTVELRKLRLYDGDKLVTALLAEGWKNVSVNHCLGAAKAALNYAVDNNILHKNPFRRIKKLPEDQRRRVATDDEFTKLLKATEKSIAWRGVVSSEENAQTMQDVLRTLRFTGLRPGELRKLRWDHLRLDGEGPVWWIVIPARSQKTGSTAKTPEDRRIPLLIEAKVIFERRRKDYGTQPYVFPNLNDEVWTGAAFAKRFALLRKRAGLDVADHNGEQLVWYSLRHTRLTEAGTTEGWSFFNLMTLAGHTDPKMTKRYVHPQEEELSRAMLDGKARRNAKDSSTRDTKLDDKGERSNS